MKCTCFAEKHWFVRVLLWRIPCGVTVKVHKLKAVWFASCEGCRGLLHSNVLHSILEICHTVLLLIMQWSTFMALIQQVLITSHLSNFCSEGCRGLLHSNVLHSILEICHTVLLLIMQWSTFMAVIQQVSTTGH